MKMYLVETCDGEIKWLCSTLEKACEDIFRLTKRYNKDVYDRVNFNQDPEKVVRDINWMMDTTEECYWVTHLEVDRPTVPILE